MNPESILVEHIGKVKDTVLAEAAKFPSLPLVPSFVVSRLSYVLGDYELSIKVLSYRIDRQFIRINTLAFGGDVEKGTRCLERKGYSLTPLPWCPYGFRVNRSPYKLGASPEYLKGYYQIQGPASMLPVHLLRPEPGDVVLDVAAAPGVKTSQAAQLMENRGLIVALDVNPSRLRSMRSNLSRLGVHNAVVLHMDGCAAHSLPLRFDKTLVDAPCSGEGNIVFAEKWRVSRTYDDVIYLANLQVRLLRSAILATRPGGIIVYCTCTFSPEENELVVDSVVKAYTNKVEIIEPPMKVGYPGLTEYYGLRLNPDLENCIRLFPLIHGCEGFFICMLRRK